MERSEKNIFISPAWGKRVLLFLGLVTFLETSLLPVEAQARRGRTGAAQEMSADDLNGLWQNYHAEQPGISFSEYCAQNNPSRSNRQDLSRTSDYIVRDLERQASQRPQTPSPAVGIATPVMSPIPVASVGPHLDSNIRQMIANYQSSTQVRRMVEMAEQVGRTRSTGRCVRHVKSLLGSSGVSRDFAGDGTIRSWDLERSLRGQGFVNIAPGAGHMTPASAPEGSILIYYNPSLPLNARYQRGHVEIKTSRGGVSDFRRSFNSNEGVLGRNWQLVGVYIRDFGSSPSAILASR